MKIKPLLDKVVIEEIKQENITKSGIIMPSSQEKSQLAKVIAVGKGGFLNGKYLPMEVSVGDIVLYSVYAGTDFKLEDKNYKILSQNDIMAIIKEKE